MAFLRIFVRRPLGHADGIPVYAASISLKESDKPGFMQATKEALQLLKATDLYRYRLVKAHISGIVEFPNPSFARYHLYGGTCEIDFHKLEEVEQMGLPQREFYACLLVHEATHGHLNAKGIRYTQREKLRIERACNRQAAKYARKMSAATTLVRIFELPVRPTKKRSWWQRMEEAKRLRAERTKDRGTEGAER